MRTETPGGGPRLNSQRFVLEPQHRQAVAQAREGPQMSDSRFGISSANFARLLTLGVYSFISCLPKFSPFNIRTKASGTA